MNTAQTLLTQGNQTQQVQAVTNVLPWIALAVAVVVVVLVFFKRKGK